MGVELQGKWKLTGIVTTFTGLAIGHNSLGSGNGSLPRLVVRHPLTGLPFIPASSLRGGVRKALAKTATAAEQPLVQDFFGAPAATANDFSTLPARATFRDLYLTDESVQKLTACNHDSYLTGIRVYANTDRVTAQGNAYALEEIPAGSQFRLEILFSVYQKDDLGHFATFLSGLQSLEQEALGGHGSRGAGQIRFGTWPMDEHHCLAAEATAGLELVWRSAQYYQTGTGELDVIRAEEKLSLAEMCQQYRERLARKGVRL